LHYIPGYSGAKRGFAHKTPNIAAQRGTPSPSGQISSPILYFAFALLGLTRLNARSLLKFRAGICLALGWRAEFSAGRQEAPERFLRYADG
jgi:hypothetical protein